MEYIIETYDKENRLNYPSGQGKWTQQSFLHFQMSGQGPYFGQLVWFKFYHPKKNLEGVNDRYENEYKRVTGVIDAHLKRTGTPFLAGDKLTYVDLAWVPWFHIISSMALGPEGWNASDELPYYGKWFESLRQRESVKTVYAKPEFQRH
jgi:glutathione S-transferase